MKVAIELDIPDGAVNQAAETEFVRAVKEQAVLKLYSEDRISTGEGAAMLGKTRVDFLDLLRTSGVGFRVDFDEQDFAQFRDIRDRYASQAK